MSLKVFLAGCSKDERERVQSVVRAAFQGREIESWTVSLVRVQDKWSVTLDGPAIRGVTFATTEERLRDSIAGVLSGGRSDAAAPEPGAEPPKTERRDRHQCQECRQPFVVIYETLPKEEYGAAPVACPHCWRINHVPVAEWARSGRDYRAEKIEA